MRYVAAVSARTERSVSESGHSAVRTRKRSHNTPLALAGLGALAVLASMSGGASNAQPVEAAGRVPASPSADPQAIRSVDFGSIAQPGSTCRDGLRFTPPVQIPVSDGQSQVLDLAELTQLVVDPAVAYGDVDGDGSEDAVVHVTCTYGANGAEDTVSVWSLDGDDVVQRASIDGPPSDLGSDLPPAVQAVQASGGDVVVTWSMYAEGDPRVAPSQHAQVTYELDGDELSEAGDPVTSAAQP
jgi:hypothetical protein